MSETVKSSTSHRPWKELAFFAAGFIFDAVLVRRIDETRTLVQQGIYLTIDGVLLAWIIAARQRAPSQGWTERLPRIADWLLHFTLGTLLNAFALFYLKSASGVATILFFLIIAALLLINELPSMRRFGPVVLYALYSFCLTSYFAYLYPVLIGRMRSWMFVLAVATSAVPLTAIAFAHHRWSRNRRQVILHALVPSLGVQALLIFLYAVRLIPPVPLSLMEIGIYHQVDRIKQGEYRVAFRTPPWYRFWQRDDSEFPAVRGDRVYCFFRVFAPNGFHDDVRVRWLRKTPQDWAAAGDVAVTINGGRDAGSAGYVSKQNWQLGDWRVIVDTPDGREIGRREFSVVNDSSSGSDRQMSVLLR